ncbi:AMP nucleosidase [Litorimonas cladophorae]|uniref:AMP nucleosidase n=2 Tax=Litorimonas cladophorae TaxID=1220491 RepID=A0A918KTC6_9PROT|nr:AMP nucleosidase [Litorimonas cladophorae]GGX73568.1 AMP nucleosidase [Litorimonas cladophorae]
MKLLGHIPTFFNDLAPCNDMDEAIRELGRIYHSAVDDLNTDFETYATTGKGPVGPKPTYPYLLLRIGQRHAGETKFSGFVSIRGPGWYGTTITSPDIFEGYLLDQLSRIEVVNEVEYYVGPSDTPIPLVFAIDPSAFELSAERSAAIGQHFPLPDLTHINDDLADGVVERASDEPYPLALFPALRTDYSLQRLRHYTGTAPGCFQQFVIFTNYQRYVDEFVEHAREVVGEGSEFTGFCAPGQGVITNGADYAEDPNYKLPQMPAYHLMAEDGMGITLINIGVGPSNAKTITDHVAVLRSHCWLMLGHCGGLRSSQILGDFVLAHAYLRDDQVLDDVLPSDIPLPTIAEVQIALTDAIGDVMELSGQEMKRHVRTGTVVTTDDRNWEMRYAALRPRLNQSRAIAIDMESATIAANGYRFRVPYGTLLCVSDRPLHGEIKLPGTAAVFYRSRVAQHLNIGLEAMRIMKNGAETGTLHSRKLRSLDDPVFR